MAQPPPAPPSPVIPTRQPVVQVRQPTSQRVIAEPAPVAVEKPLPAPPVAVEPEVAEPVPVPDAAPAPPPLRVHATITASLVAVADHSGADSQPRRTKPVFLVVAVEPTVAVDWVTTVSTASHSTSPGSAVGADPRSASARCGDMAISTFARSACFCGQNSRHRSRRSGRPQVPQSTPAQSIPEWSPSQVPQSSPSQVPQWTPAPVIPQWTPAPDDSAVDTGHPLAASASSGDVAFAIPDTALSADGVTATEAVVAQSNAHRILGVTVWMASRSSSVRSACAAVD